MGGHGIWGFLQALRDVFGAVQSDSAQNAAAYSKVLVTGQNCELYGIDLIASAAGAGTFLLVDATATGIGGTVRWGTSAIPTTFTHEFVRPIKFSKGITISYTATAAVTLGSNITFGTGPNPVI